MVVCCQHNLGWDEMEMFQLLYRYDMYKVNISMSSLNVDEGMKVTQQISEFISDASSLKLGDKVSWWKIKWTIVPPVQ